MKYKNILCPFDYSQTSMAALDKATELARQFDAKLHIIQVYEYLFAASAAETMAPIPVYPDVEALQRRLAKVEPADIETTRELVYGIPGSAILSYAQCNENDLIVMGNRSDLGVLRWLVGSVTESVMRHAPCPVLVVHAPAFANKAKYKHEAQASEPTFAT